MNVDAERKATEIRLRAERKAGELLREQEKAKGTRGQLSGGRIVKPPEEAPTLAQLGISKTQSARWQQLPAVLQARFEAALWPA